MTDQHCPGFESNKTLDEVTIKCPGCGKKLDIFSDELEKNIKCPECSASIDPKTCQV